MVLKNLEKNHEVFVPCTNPDCKFETDIRVSDTCYGCGAELNNNQ